MANLIVTAILKVREYPTLGECYYNVLQKTYLTKDKTKETDILYDLEISRSTYYKYKKDAVKIFGYCLWQIIIPNMKKERSTQSGQLLPVVGYVGQINMEDGLLKDFLWTFDRLLMDFVHTKVGLLAYCFHTLDMLHFL